MTVLNHPNKNTVHFDVDKQWLADLEKKGIAKNNRISLKRLFQYEQKRYDLLMGLAAINLILSFLLLAIRWF